MRNEEEQNDKRATEVLEVEDEERRQERMRRYFYLQPLNAPLDLAVALSDSLFSRLNAGSTPGPAPLNGLPSRPFEFGDRDTFPAPPSDCTFESHPRMSIL